MKIGQSIIYLIILSIALLGAVFVDSKINKWIGDKDDKGNSGNNIQKDIQDEILEMEMEIETEIDVQTEQDLLLQIPEMI